MKRIHLSLPGSLCLLLCVGCGVISCRSQDVPPALPPGGMKVLESPGGGQVIYGLVPEQSSLSDGMFSTLRMVHAHFGDRPRMADFLKARDGNSLAAFFTVASKTEADKPIAGLVIVAAASGATLQYAVLYDEEDRFVSTEPALLHLLASAGKTSPTGTPTTLDHHAPAGLGPFHIASGGDKSATICLPADWTISQVSSGSLTAKGPHSEIVALGFMQMVLDPSNAEARQLAHTSSLKNVPRAKFPDEGNLFATFTDVLNQLRATNKLPPASFTLISSKKLDASSGKLRPLQAVYNLDLGDGVGARKGSARIDVYRPIHGAQWALIVSTSSVPLAYAADEESTVLAIIKSFRQEAPAVRNIEDAHGPGGDPGHWDPDRKGYVFGYRRDSRNCATIGGPGTDTGWPGKIAESFILGPPSSQDSADGSQADAASKLSDSLLKSHPDLFDILKIDNLIADQDY